MDRLYDDGQLYLGEFRVIRRCALGKNLKSNVDGRVFRVLHCASRMLGFFRGNLAIFSPPWHCVRGESVWPTKHTITFPNEPTNARPCEDLWMEKDDKKNEMIVNEYYSTTVFNDSISKEGEKDNLTVNMPWYRTLCRNS